MKLFTAEAKLDKTEFNSQVDWKTSPTANYTCQCNQVIELNFLDFEKHAKSDYSNLNEADNEKISRFIEHLQSITSTSFLDFYCPKCGIPIKILFDSWAGGNHGEYGFVIKYVITDQ